MRLPEEDLAASATRVGIGEHAVGGLSDSYRVNLGSCVGVCLVWPRESRFAVAHVLLPSARAGIGAQHAPSRFADEVIPFLIEQVGSPERQRELVAYVAGASSQFNSSSNAATVGDLNRAAILESLRTHRIRIGGEDFGGDHPRQLVVDGATSTVASITYGDEASSVSWDLPQTFGLVQ